nr:iron donor protein CyaY [Cryptococcus depauperatus CBS 7855]
MSRLSDASLSHPIPSLISMITLQTCKDDFLHDISRETAEDSPATPTPSPETYERVSERDMETLLGNLERMVEDYGDGHWEVEYSSGVLTLSLPPHGTYVLNKQPPNLQIWMSSPVSGPSRFNWTPDADGRDGAWVHHRRDVRLGALLDGELRAVLCETNHVQDWRGVGLK